VIVSDWRELPVESAAHLYRGERARWHRRLSWETADTWKTIETARVTWGLPGLVCREHGRVVGWTFYLPRAGAIDIGGLYAEHEGATIALVDGLLQHAQAIGAPRGFFYLAAPGAMQALTDRGLRVTRFLYLVAELDAPALPLPPMAHAAGAGSPWTEDRIDDAARLLQAAYGEAGRLYAPRNELQEWRMYVSNLVADSACGRFSPALSRVVERDARLAGMAMVTAVGPATAHLAQIAVHPGDRRSGIARDLLCGLLPAAGRQGFSRLSLLVSAENTPALDLYRALGFTPRDAFLAIA
jgi:ribosomal protein S18 acetylase RimI-like enzyme